MTKSEFPPVLKSRYASTIFCDDVRVEASGKILVVGMYGAGLFVQQYPAAIPFLHLMVTGSTPEDDPFKKLTIRVYLGQEVVSELELEEPPSEVDPQPIEDALPGEPTTRVQRFQALIRLQPLVIEKEATLRVRVYTERETLQAGALKIADVHSIDS